MELEHRLAEFCAISAPSGFEEKAAKAMVEALKPYTNEAYIDRFGNAVGILRCGLPNAKRVLLDAHLDEVGLIVTGAEEGFLRFRSIGGVDGRILPDREVTILTEPPIFGVIACLPPHVQEAADQNTATPISDLWIDVGMGQEMAESRVPVGTPVVFRREFSLLQGDFCAGNALDDRAGLVALLRAAEFLQGKNLSVDVIFMGSSREETGGSGAAVGTFALEPDFCIAVDVTHGKTPDSTKEESFPLGKGPAIGIGPNMTRWMSQGLMETAQGMELSYQREVMAGNSGTNGWKMQVTREGLPTAVVSIPLRYMHTPNEVMKLSDLEDTAALLSGYVQTLGEVDKPC